MQERVSRFTDCEGNDKIKKEYFFLLLFFFFGCVKNKKSDGINVQYYSFNSKNSVVDLSLGIASSSSSSSSIRLFIIYFSLPTHNKHRSK